MGLSENVSGWFEKVFSLFVKTMSNQYLLTLVLKLTINIVETRRRTNTISLNFEVITFLLHNNITLKFHSAFPSVFPIPAPSKDFTNYLRIISLTTISSAHSKYTSSKNVGSYQMFSQMLKIYRLKRKQYEKSKKVTIKEKRGRRKSW